MLGPKRPMRVLLVEDNPADVRLTREAFREADPLATLAVVHDGVEAIDYLRRSHPFTAAERPDLVLLDLNLPRKGGHEVLSEVKADPDLGRLPVVVFSTSRAPADVGRCY